MPKGFNITVEGMDELKKKFGDRTNSMLSDISGEIEGAAYNIQQKAVSDAPADEGGLRQSITVNKIDKLNFEVVVQKEYAAYMEFGTGSKVKIPPGLETYAAQFRGSKGGSFKDLVAAIVRWVHRKGISGTYSTKSRRRQGSKLNQYAEDYKIAYLIAISIITKGVKAHPFLFHNVTEEEPKFRSEIQKIING